MSLELIVLAFVGPWSLVCVAAGAYLWHRAAKNRSPVPDFMENLWQSFRRSEDTTKAAMIGGEPKAEKDRARL
jgi:hypothetical protein